MPGWSFPKPAVVKAMNDPLVLWDQFADSINLDPSTRSDISNELASSVKWQAYSYDHPPTAPTLQSPSIDWEQSIVEGHPTHPVRVLSVLPYSQEDNLLTDDTRCTRHAKFCLLHARLHQAAMIYIPHVCASLHFLVRV
jgi:hypothetical protein